MKKCKYGGRYIKLFNTNNTVSYIKILYCCNTLNAFTHNVEYYVFEYIINRINNSVIGPTYLRISLSDAVFNSNIIERKEFINTFNEMIKKSYFSTIIKESQEERFKNEEM